MMGEPINYRPVIDEAKELLDANLEWRERYLDYVARISENMDFIKANRQRFREWFPFKLYLNTTNAKNAKRRVVFELRYLGQTVAELVCNSNDIKLSTIGYDEKNKRDFDCTIAISRADWEGTEAAAFRSHFKKRQEPRNKTDDNSGNEEHRIESLLMSEASEKENKTLLNIKPVLIAGLRFPMPTPLSASNHSRIKYANFHGGGIDM